MVKMTLIEHMISGIIPCLEEEIKSMWMRETRIRLSMQMEIVAYKDECKWLLKCYHSIVSNCPEKYCPPMPLPIIPDYTKNLRGDGK